MSLKLCVASLLGVAAIASCLCAWKLTLFLIGMLVAAFVVVTAMERLTRWIQKP